MTRAWLARLLARLRADQRGATIIEFAMVAPVLLLTILGLFDMAYNMYSTAMLEGAIQKAARDATLEGAAPATVDARVAAAVHAVVPGARLAYSRKAYFSFTDVGQPEDYTDVNTNGLCDNGEPFEDANGNGDWDADRGSVGNGGARDAVLYSVTATYDHAFPLTSIAGLSGTVSARSETVLRNQPFGLQAAELNVIGHCA